jgi:hypothetical protein
MLQFSNLQRQVIKADFSGGNVTSNAGVFLLREVDKKMSLTSEIASILQDKRDSERCTHQLINMLRQRVYAIALGDEDLNDHNELRHDIALQAAVESSNALASPSTLCRFEAQSNREWAWGIHRILMKNFIESFSSPPEELILDFDATDHKLFGSQEKRHFHGYYDAYCYLPLYVFCGDQLLVSYLRPASCGGAYHALAVLSLLVKALRAVWPDVKLIYRGDTGFYTPAIIRWCEKNNIRYLVGYTVNKKLMNHPDVIAARSQAKQSWEQEGEPQKWFSEVTDYQSASWLFPRRLVIKAEHNSLGENTRAVLTDFTDDAEAVYAHHYCQRGDMENRIKEQKWLFSDRNSCTKWWPNQIRVLLASIAYTLLEALRWYGLGQTEGERWQTRTLRLKLLKIAAVITRNTRTIRLCMSSSIPEKIQNLMALAIQRLVPG